MPEGDTIHKLARALAPVLSGRLESVWLRDLPHAARLQGGTVFGLRAIGKHLLIGVSAPGEPDRILRTHLGLHGSWRRYPASDPRGRPGERARVILRTADTKLVCLQAPQVEVFRAADLGRHRALSALGPDLIDPPVCMHRVLAQARAAASAVTIGELLLDQRVAAGIGNVFKCELLFLAGIHPWRAAARVPPGILRALYGEAQRLLIANVAPGPRTTTRDPVSGRPRSDRELLWVYGRHGRPCLRCGVTIRTRRQGEQARPTWWCPGCQPQAGHRTVQGATR